VSLLLSLDISTSCTGFAVFDRETKRLIRSGRIKPQVPGLHKLKYPKAALKTIISMAGRVNDLVMEVNPDRIVVEEVNRGINRIGQKSLDAVHFFVLDRMTEAQVDSVSYVDSNGKKGWRGMLGLKLSEQDKQVNAEIRLRNKKVKKSAKAPVIDWKVLAQRWVNAKFGTSYNVWENPGDNDEVDSIALGWAFLEHVDSKLHK